MYHASKVDHPAVARLGVLIELLYLTRDSKVEIQYCTVYPKHY